MTLLTSLLFCGAAQATDQPDAATDQTVLASNTLKLDRIKEARIVEVLETNQPFVFTYCRIGSPSLWRHEVMSSGQPDTWHGMRITKDQVVQSDSESCNEKG